MKTWVWLALLLVGVPGWASTNYVVCVGDVPVMHGVSVSWNTACTTVMVGPHQLDRLDWSVVRVVSTTDKIPEKFTDIKQVKVLETVLPLSVEVEADWRRKLDPQTVAVVEGIVAAINAKSETKVTDAELKAAIEAKLSTVEVKPVVKEDGK